MIWLRKIVPGGTDRSYGIEVARMAGVPSSVLERASEILTQLEEESRGRKLLDRGQAVTPAAKRVQLKLFEAEEHPVLRQLKSLDTYAMSPIEALNALHEMREKLAKSKRADKKDEAP